MAGMDEEEARAVEQVTVRLNPCSGHEMSSLPNRVSVRCCHYCCALSFVEFGCVICIYDIIEVLRDEGKGMSRCFELLVLPLLLICAW
jgi:hypothetical protein